VLGAEEGRVQGVRGSYFYSDKYLLLRSSFTNGVTQKKPANSPFSKQK